jgi:DnaJ-class molecular chaperone
MSYDKLKKKVRGARHYFELLGVHLQSTVAEIKQAHRNLAREFHPDVNCDPIARDIMPEINVAYSTLTDDKTRKHYLAIHPGKPCDACKGRGCTTKQKGFTKTVSVVCATCGGIGKC